MAGGCLLLLLWLHSLLAAREGRTLMNTRQGLVHYYDLTPESYLATIEGLPGVSGVRGRLWGYHFEPNLGANFTVIVDDGDIFQPQTMIIGYGIARTFFLQKGNSISLTAFDGKELKFKIAEIFSSESELVTADLIWLTTSDFYKLFGVPKGWSVIYPHFRLVPHVDLYQVMALFFLTVVPYTAATILPSWKAAIIDPDEVMRM